MEKAKKKKKEEVRRHHAEGNWQSANHKRFLFRPGNNETREAEGQTGKAVYVMGTQGDNQEEQVGEGMRVPMEEYLGNIRSYTGSTAETLHCNDTQDIPDILRGIRRNTAKPKKSRKNK